MAKKTKKETSLPLIISLVFFVLLSIGLGVFCYVLNSDMAQKEKAADDAKKELKNARDLSKEAELIARIQRIYLGLDDGEDRTVVGTDVAEGSKPALALKDLQDKVAKKLAVDPLPPDFDFWKIEFDEKKMLKLPAKGGGLMDVVAPLYDRSNKAVTANAAAAKGFDTARKDMDSKVKSADDARVAFDKAATDIPARFIADLKKANDQKDTIRTTFQKEIVDVRKSEDALKDDIAARELALTKLREQLKGVQADLSILNEKAKAKQDVFQFDEPQGKILRRLVENNVVEIDLGSAALVRPGLTFTVLPYDFPEKGRQSRMFVERVPDERGNYKANVVFRPKATIEVIEVLGPNLSRARITEEYSDIRDRAMPGDLLYNSVWRKGGAAHIVLVGIFDVNGDGTDDIEAVVRDLTKMGIPVDAYYDLRTRKWVGRITDQTRYVIEGYTPSNSANDPNQKAKSDMIAGLTAAKDEARNKGIAIVNFRDVFPRMGYKANLHVSEDRINQAAARYLAGVGTADAAPPPNPNP